MCAHRRLRSACASAQSDQRRRWVANGPTFFFSDRKLWLLSDCADAQTDSNLNYMHMPTCFLCWPLDWIQSLKQFFINVSYHIILVASLILMALFKDWFNWHYNIRGGASLHPSIPDLIGINLSFTAPSE